MILLFKYFFIKDIIFLEIELIIEGAAQCEWRETEQRRHHENENETRTEQIHYRVIF
jgi:hypothetical protein